jgi:putative ABC transport system substrate-binding protein
MLGLLHDLIPKATSIAALLDPDFYLDTLLTDARKAAAKSGLQLDEFSASTDHEIEAAFASMVEHHAEAVLIPTNPYFLSQVQNIVGLAAHHGLPAMYGNRGYAAAGGLISYGSNLV